MKAIVECVPNFSEGRNKQTIEAIARAIKETEGCKLLDVDPGKSTNRTVYTFVGDPDAVVEGALAAAKVARELIDMRHHQGEHPRFGAMDVCPFIPVAGVTMEECVQLAEKFASRCADELGVPFYLYEEAIYPSSPTSFTPLPKFPWAKDDTFYYYEGRRIENADYSTFEILEKGRYNFARDKDHYYWEGWRLDDVDYHSFEIEHGAKGRDSKYVYKFKKKESARDASGSEYMDVIKKGIKRDAPNQ